MELRAFADGVTQTLGVARDLVEVGRSVDLARLEEQVGLLSAKALDLLPAEGPIVLAELVTTLARIEALSVALLRPTTSRSTGSRHSECQTNDATWRRPSRRR